VCVCVRSLNFPVNSIAEIASLGMKTHICLVIEKFSFTS